MYHEEKKRLDRYYAVEGKEEIETKTKRSEKKGEGGEEE